MVWPCILTVCFGRMFWEYVLSVWYGRMFECMVWAYVLGVCFGRMVWAYEFGLRKLLLCTSSIISIHDQELCIVGRN